MSDDGENDTAKVNAAAEWRRFTSDEIDEAAFDATVMQWGLPNPADERRERDAQPMTHGDAAEIMRTMERNTAAILEAMSAMSANMAAARKAAKEIAIPLWLIFGLLLAEIMHLSGSF